MNSISNIPKGLISDILHRHTGMYFEPSKIDYVTANHIANAVVALDSKLISKRKYMKIIEFNYNNLLDREGLPMRYVASKANSMSLRINLFYN